MNMKLLAGFGVVLVILLVFPLLPTLMPLLQQGSAPSPEEVKAAEAAMPNDPPLLTNENLIGSVWEVRVQGIPIRIALNGGGQAVATSDNPLVKAYTGTDTLSGTWSVSGNKLHAAVDFKGENKSIDLHISGSNVYLEGKPIQRIQ